MISLFCLISLNKILNMKMPHPVVLLFFIIVCVAGLSYFIPSGLFERELVNGKNMVIPGTFQFTNHITLGFFDIFKAMGRGFQSASEIIFVVFAGAIMFGMLSRSGMVENVIGTLIRYIGVNRRMGIVVFSTFIFGFLGVAVGYENNIAVVPIAAALSLAIGGDLLLAAGISVGAITIGFGLSPINPYTVGIGHQIAEMQIFSGALVRSALCFGGLALLSWFNVRYFKKILNDPEKSMSKDLPLEGLQLNKPLEGYVIKRIDTLVLSIFLFGLGTMIYGVFYWDWFINDISAIFMVIALLVALLCRMNPQTVGNTIYQSLSMSAPGAFMVGFAATIRVLLEQAQMTDTISFYLSEILTEVPTGLSAIAMSISQSVINFFIPSGSGQALATLPIMIPIGDLLGLSRQCTILAFQIGDGVTNLVNPTLGGLIAMLALIRVPIDRWIKYILPLAFYILAFSWIVLSLAVLWNWN
jgi:uncharacterized ion transporter superfamily protein YfcC